MIYMGACRGTSSTYDEWAEISDDNGLKNFYESTATVHFTEQDLDYDPHVNLNANGNGILELTAPTNNPFIIW